MSWGDHDIPENHPSRNQKKKVDKVEADVIEVKKISDLVRELKHLMRIHGDLPLTIDMNNEVYVSINEYEEGNKLDIRDYPY